MGVRNPTSDISNQSCWKGKQKYQKHAVILPLHDLKTVHQINFVSESDDFDMTGTWGGGIKILKHYMVLLVCGACYIMITTLVLLCFVA